MRMTNERARRGIASLLTGLVTGAALLGATPAASAEPSAGAQAEPRMKCVEHAPYFFHGESWQPGGFSTEAPTNEESAKQLAHSGYNDGGERGVDHHAASWVDSFQGELCGQTTVTVHLASVRSGDWRIVVIADGDDTLAFQAVDQDAFTPQEVTVTFRPEAAVAEKLEFRVYPLWSIAGAVLFDSPEYAAGFTVSTLEPCEVNDPHPDCVEAGFADLAGDVRAFASTGEATADGKIQLLAVLDDAEIAYGYGYNAEAVTLLEDFQQLAADPALVPSEPARDSLTTSASGLITALEASGPA